MTASRAVQAEAPFIREAWYLHESFHPDQPTLYTRPWFAWANSLFSELVLYWAPRAGYAIPYTLLEA